MALKKRMAQAALALLLHRRLTESEAAGPEVQRRYGVHPFHKKYRGSFGFYTRILVSLS